jgi:epoxyqueuosine reductase
LTTPLKSQITERARELGFDQVGFAAAEPAAHADYLDEWLAKRFHGEMSYLARHPHRRKDPRSLLPEAKTIIVVALNYAPVAADVRRQSLTQIAPLHGVVARYARGDDYHELMRDKLESLAAFIREISPDAKSKICVDTSALLERELAQQSGIGFVGKSTILINRSLGTWFFLGEILTSLTLEPDPPQKNHCGKCVRCIEVCPTQAIVAPFQLDARRCISYLTIEFKGVIPRELRPLIGNRIFGCDDCLEVCPWNRFAKKSREIAFNPREIAVDTPAPRSTLHAPTTLVAPNLIALLSLNDEQFHRAFKGSPIHRIKRRGLLRNVCVALGNSGDARVIAPLASALRDHEPLIRAHAAWALGQFGGMTARNALSRALTTEHDEKVREEIESALGQRT